MDYENLNNLKMFDIIFAEKEGVGSEQSGLRPYVVIQNNMGNKNCPTIIGMSLTSSLKKEYLPTHCIIPKTKANGLKHDSMLLAETITQLDKSRIKGKVGHIENESIQNDIINVYIANVTGKKRYNSVWRKVIYLLCRLIKEGEYGNAA